MWKTMKALRNTTRARIVLVVTLLAVLAGVPSLRGDDLRSIVVLREDDLRRTWRNAYPEFGGVSAFTYCMNNQIPITWGAVTSVADGNGSEGLTWAELRQYIDAAGGEVASHSVNHREMSSVEEYINEITASRAAVEAAMGPGYVCRAFLQPGGWTDDANMSTLAKLNNPIGQAIQSTYDYSMAYLGGVWRTGSTPYRYGLTNRYSIDYSSSLTVDGVNRMLDITADCPGTVLVVSCHGVQATGGTKAYEIPANVLKAFVEKVVALRAANKIRLMGLSEAMDQVFPTDMNHIPSIKVCDPPADGTGAGPWKTIRGASMSPTGGMDGGKCLELRTDNAMASCGWISVPPGRYALTWYQKVIDGYTATSAVRASVTDFQGSVFDPSISLLNYPWYRNEVPGNWEQKKAVVLIKDHHIPQIVAFQTNAYSGQQSGCLVDGVSFAIDPTDPDISPVNVQVEPTPTGGTMTWTTPNDPSITAIECRYGTATHPLDGTQGTVPPVTANTLLFSVPPELGGTQTVPFNLTWSGKSRVFFSVFAKRGSAYSEPGIDYVMVSSASPTVSLAQVAPATNGQTTVSWSVQSPSAPVHSSYYALGLSAGGTDLLDWTPATGTSASLDVPVDGPVFVSVKAQSVFGYWSNTDSKQIPLAVSIREVREGPDDETASVTLSGYVTAVFSHDFYLESADRASGIRVKGGTGVVVEGQYVTVTGTIGTENGERYLKITP